MTRANAGTSGSSSRRAAANLMEVGAGTPWEDRGNLGVIKAFFQTCWMAMTDPKALITSIRRPEGHADALGFAIGCSLLWLFGCLITGVIYYFWITTRAVADKAARRPWIEVDPQWYFIKWVAAGLFLAMLVLGSAFLTAAIMKKLAGAEESGKAPQVLFFNVVAYSLGGSLLALIPFVGVAIAPLLILRALISGSLARLHLSTGGSLSCAIIATIASAGTVLILLCIGAWVWSMAIDPYYVKCEPPKPKVFPG